MNALNHLVPMIDWTKEPASAYAYLRTELASAGTPIGAMDMLIAASALVEKAILVTNNTAPFPRISRLCLEN